MSDKKENLQPNLKKGSLGRISSFRGNPKRGGDLFQRGCHFYIKNKVKYEIFKNDKKSF